MASVDLNPYESPKDSAQQQAFGARLPFRLRWILIPLAIALLFTVGFEAYVSATSIGVAYPEQTDEEAAYENRHWAIAMPLLFAALAAWLITGIAALAWGISVTSSLIKRIHSSLIQLRTR